MNNRIMATLFALAIALFIGVVPVKAEAAEAECQHVHDANCGYVECNCKSEKAHTKAVENGTCAGEYEEGVSCKFEQYDGVCIDLDHTCKCDACYAPMHDLKLVKKQDATCTESGLEKHYECANNCGNWFKDAAGEVPVTRAEVTIEATGHQKEWIIDEEAGTHKKVCTVCGEVFHGLEEHVFETVTDNKDGTHTKKCKYCQYEVTEAHYDEDDTCKCDVCYAELEHTPGEMQYGTYNHWYVCAKCGAMIEETKTAHTLGYVANEYGNETHSVACTAEGCGYEVSKENCVDENEDHYCDKCEAVLKHPETNSGYMKVISKWPTCTESGWWQHYQCTICGLRVRNGAIVTEEEMFRPATGHTAGSAWFSDEDTHYRLCKDCYPDEEVKIEDTIAAHEFEYKTDGKGGHIGTCKICGYVQKEATAHDFGEPVYAVVNGVDSHKTTCQTCGAVKTVACEDENGDCVCDVCGTLRTHAIRDSSVRTVEAKEATCTTSGYEKHYQCEDCGVLLNLKGEVVTIEDVTTKALGHDWEYRNDTLSGKHIVKCVTCKAYETVGHTDTDNDCLCDIGDCNTLVHSHTHVYVAEVAPTCGKAGTEAYYYYKDCGRMFDMEENEISGPISIPALDHVASDKYEAIEGGMHAIKCENCGEVIETEAHTDGNNDNRCDVCGIELTLEYIPQVDPTCTDIGYKACWKSPVTGRIYADENGNEYITSREVIPATGHVYTTSNGAQHVCGVCGHAANHTASKEHPCFCDVCLLPLGDHDVTVVDTVEATCTKAGTMAYVKCASCGKMYDALTGAEITAPVTIPATGHKLSNELVESSKTGDHYQVCTNDGCDYQYHSEHEPVVEDPLKGNYHQWVCECGYVKTEIHSDTNGDNKCDECGHDMANTSVNVEQHDSVTVVTGEKDTVDNTKSWWQNWLQNLLPGNASGTSSSKTTTTTTETGTAASGTTTTTNNGTGSTGNASSSGTQSSTASTGVINEFIQWLTNLFNVWFQSK